MTNTNIPLISITIATWSRRSLLEKLLLSLQRQSVDLYQYEVIVCDSSSPDGTVAMVRSLQQSCAYNNISYLNISKNTLAAKRNALLNAAKARLIVFLDDDVLVEEDFVRAHLDFHSDDENIVGCGQVRFPSHWIKGSNYFRYRDSRHIGPDRMSLMQGDLDFKHIVVMNLSFHKDAVIARVGGVSEAFTRYGCEDIEFGYRLKQGGFRMRYVPGALVYHYEAGGTVSQYMKKLFVTARDSAPVLYRLVPASSLKSVLTYLEPTDLRDSIKTKVKKQIVRAVLFDWLSRAICSFLERTDRYRFLYFPALFHYVCMCAFFSGVRKRGESTTNDGLGWF